MAVTSTTRNIPIHSTRWFKVRERGKLMSCSSADMGWRWSLSAHTFSHTMTGVANRYRLVRLVVLQWSSAVRPEKIPCGNILTWSSSCGVCALHQNSYCHELSTVRLLNALHLRLCSINSCSDSLISSASSQALLRLWARKDVPLVVTVGMKSKFSWNIF